jgi:hypothetical protein
MRSNSAKGERGNDGGNYNIKDNLCFPHVY